MLIKRKPSTASVGMRCSDCIFHQKMKGNFNGNRTCKSIGIKSFAHACKHFTPEVSKLVKVSEDALCSLALIARDLSPSVLRILSYVFKNAEQIQKYGFKFGQPVYFNLSSPRIDYLDCYFKGYVIGISKDGEYAYLSSSLDLKEPKKLVFLTLPISQVMKKRAYTMLVTELTELDRVKTPNNLKDSKFKSNIKLTRAHKKATIELGDVPTLDTVPASWLYKNTSNELDIFKPRKKKKLNYSVDKSGRTVQLEY